MPQSRRQFWSYARELKAAFPLSMPVKTRTLDRVLSEDGDRLFGDCDDSGGVFVIRIERNKDEGVMVCWLLHEWAHAMVMGKHRGHGRAYFDAYGRVYRHFLEEDSTQQEN